MQEMIAGERFTQSKGSILALCSQMCSKERTSYYCPRNASTLLINTLCGSTKLHSFSSLPWKCRYYVI